MNMKDQITIQRLYDQKVQNGRTQRRPEDGAVAGKPAKSKKVRGQVKRRVPDVADPAETPKTQH